MYQLSYTCNFLSITSKQCNLTSANQSRSKRHLAAWQIYSKNATYLGMQKRISEYALEVGYLRNTLLFFNLVSSGPTCTNIAFLPRDSLGLLTTSMLNICFHQSWELWTSFIEADLSYCYSKFCVNQTTASLLLVTSPGRRIFSRRDGL